MPSNFFLQQLKFKILIKNKKVGTLEETLQRRGQRCLGQIAELEEVMESEDDLIDEDPKAQLIKKPLARLASAPKKDKKDKKVNIPSVRGRGGIRFCLHFSEKVANSHFLNQNMNRNPAIL